MRPRSNLERRRNLRLSTPNGLWVSCKFGDTVWTSRVEDLSASGAFIATMENPPVGSRLELHFSLPEGHIRIQAVVRNVRSGRGVGVEFVSMGGREFEIVLQVVRRLLG